MTLQCHLSREFKLVKSYKSNLEGYIAFQSQTKNLKFFLMILYGTKLDLNETLLVIVRGFTSILW